MLAEQLLLEVLAIPALSGQEDARATFLQKRLGDLFGNAVERIGNNLVVRLGNPKADKVLLLCSHIDTVQAADGWTKNPFTATTENGRIYGLGANDALASGVAMVEALSRISDFGDKGVMLAWVAEEEEGSNGFCAIEPQLHYSSAIFGEPTDMRVGNAMRGYMRIKLKGQGVACHASRPWEGKNAIFDLTAQLAKVETLPLKDNSPWGQATVQPTLLKAGASVNAIPDTAEAILDIRPTSEIDNMHILALLDAAGCTYEVIFNRRQPMYCAPDSEVIQAIAKALPDHRTYAFGGSCDMAFARKPSVVMGPGKSTRSHAADEYIETNELIDAADKYERVIKAFILS